MPGRLASRLLDTVAADPAGWLRTIGATVPDTSAAAALFGEADDLAVRRRPAADGIISGKPSLTPVQAYAGRRGAGPKPAGTGRGK